MTYARKAGSFAAAITAAVAAVGSAAASAAAGVSPSRLRQLSNPCRQDSRALDVAVAIDAASAAAGSGTPIFDLYRSRLIAAGARPSFEVRAARLQRLARRIGLLLLAAAGEREAMA